ncbi:MAG: pyridoxamine 5'-phosphate oxidase family protein [Shimia thalassica]|uniref:pyridoxamine 5'-phosphate oxidase family protein n=1 Tax=Shimia thalassica TaxID=1715693 RepID=UPI0026E467DF|nr:pyridoxamine 5'-phosphate oxidase family protein [Shimia thalassica]MDO6483275.1 pyridoxamine 5'-phosphate oxidase family protein [Shimia thalassica]MDP2517674.1 pyridoxamine 5'-phosphate oxidase family protein [Shimia thalassica]
MAKQFDKIETPHRTFIEAQHLFFVGSAAPTGRVNISPKGMDSLRVLSHNRIIWRNLTGSGNETAGHLKQSNRMTLMWCGFEKRPMILRAYGSARTLHRRDPEFDELNALFPEIVSARQIYDMHVDMVQTSCGYAVPFYDFVEDRDTLAKWAEDRGPEGIQTYWEDRNQHTIDGMPTDILGDPDDT